MLGCALWFAASPAFGQAFPVHNVSPLGGQSTFPAMAVGPAGDAVVAWYADAGASVALRVARYHPPTDTWSPPVDLVSFPKANAQYRYGIDDVAIDAAGNAIVIIDRARFVWL